MWSLIEGLAWLLRHAGVGQGAVQALHSQAVEQLDGSSCAR